MTEKITGPRFDILSTSESGLTFVRERRLGVMRALTEEELAGFDDPPPCPDCAEQFGCEHINSAGEPMLSETEVAAEVPAEWMDFARDHGVSRGDLLRLRSLERVDDAYRHAGDAPDVRTLEIVLLLNEQE
jgi:hypothetical protein